MKYLYVLDIMHDCHVMLAMFYLINCVDSCCLSSYYSKFKVQKRFLDLTTLEELEYVNCAKIFHKLQRTGLFLKLF